ncbi:hypothetical protein [Paenibacillus xylaniclasticus]|uniref:hypothetical protein n=1 Tax=Paenibacillus xylaniclasticus TaxID=588083 RepID=UPI000FD76E3F|nr:MULTISPECIES: hypothetical protein [Paenibacillus]GFN30944.1 hypothetical protein PCURB6_12040 [Paenibacillus curdlanolyticus]
MADQLTELIDPAEALQENQPIIHHYQHILSSIADELDSLRTGAERLQAIYGEAAVSSDLTFIKILEDRYENLIEEIRSIGGFVGAVQESLLSKAEDAEDGR